MKYVRDLTFAVGAAVLTTGCSGLNMVTQKVTDQIPGSLNHTAKNIGIDGNTQFACQNGTVVATSVGRCSTTSMRLVDVGGQQMLQTTVSMKEAVAKVDETSCSPQNHVRAMDLGQLGGDIDRVEFFSKDSFVKDVKVNDVQKPKAVDALAMNKFSNFLEVRDALVAHAVACSPYDAKAAQQAVDKYKAAGMPIRQGTKEQNRQYMLQHKKKFPVLVK